MIELSRTVRMCLENGSPRSGSGSNGYGGVPAMVGFGRHYELRVTCAGEPDERTGYLINIKDIDRAVRGEALPILMDACESGNASPIACMDELVARLDRALSGIVRAVRLSLTPTYSLEMNVNDRKRVLVRQSFDFAASHRLHAPSMSDEENRAYFGKCNNPNGHGHNYRVEPAVAVRTDGVGFSLATLEELTDATIIERFDHTHLNTDTEEFRDGSGENPTVENIARVCFDLLDESIRASYREIAELRSVTVWETDRTSATYPSA